MWQWLVLLVGALVGKLDKLWWKILAAMGIASVTYGGVSSLMASLKTQALALLSGAPAQMVQAAGLMKVDVCVSMLLSALTSAVALATVNGVVTRYRATTPPQ